MPIQTKLKCLYIVSIFLPGEHANNHNANYHSCRLPPSIEGSNTKLSLQWLLLHIGNGLNGKAHAYSYIKIHFMQGDISK